MGKRRKGPSGAQTIGGILAGFDGQVFRTNPPPHELVRKGDQLPAIPADDGGTLIVELPDDPPRAPHADPNGAPSPDR